MNSPTPPPSADNAALTADKEALAAAHNVLQAEVAALQARQAISTANPPNLNPPRSTYPDEHAELQRLREGDAQQRAEIDVLRAELDRLREEGERARVGHVEKHVAFYERFRLAGAGAGAGAEGKGK